MAFNLASLLEDLNAKLQNHPRYTDAMKLKELNKARDWLILFASDNYDVWEAFPVPDPLDTTQMLMEVPLPDDLFILQSVSFDGVPLREMTQREFISTTAEFSTSTGPPFLGYYVRANLYLNVWPRPSTAVAAKKFQIYYLRKPDDMAVDTDVPGIDRAYAESLVSRAAGRLKLSIPGEETSSGILLADAYRERAEAKFNMQANEIHRIERVSP